MRFGAAGLIVALALGILTGPLALEGQQPVKVYRVGLLGTREGPLTEVFRQRLRGLGHVEGRNLVIDYRWSEGRIDRLPALASELVSLKPDVIVASGPGQTNAVKAATSTIPVVFIFVGDPVGLGVVSSLAHPGGNITGFSGTASGEFPGKCLELLKEMVPQASRIAVLMNPTSELHRRALPQSAAASEVLKVRLQVVEARIRDELDAAFEAAARGRAEAIHVYGDPSWAVHRARFVELATMHRLPALYNSREQVEAGGLMSYAATYADIFRDLATYVDKILKGARPADLPVRQPTKFELVVNGKTARALGLIIPPSILIRADQVIE
jgi:putative ABC transport system substrate-binding protein